MSKRDEAEQAIKEWREAWEAVNDIEAPFAKYHAGRIRIANGWFRTCTLAELREWTAELRARTAARRP